MYNTTWSSSESLLLKCKKMKERSRERLNWQILSCPGAVKLASAERHWSATVFHHFCHQATTPLFQSLLSISELCRAWVRPWALKSHFYLFLESWAAMIWKHLLAAHKGCNAAALAITSFTLLNHSIYSPGASKNHSFSGSVQKI